MMIVVFFMVGILEVVSILFRPVSLSFRLFGNVYAGESMLEAMANLVPSSGVADPDSVLLSWKSWSVWSRRWCSCC